MDEDPDSVKVEYDDNGSNFEPKIDNDENESNKAAKLKLESAEDNFSHYSVIETEYNDVKTLDKSTEVIPEATKNVRL